MNLVQKFWNNVLRKNFLGSEHISSKTSRENQLKTIESVRRITAFHAGTVGVLAIIALYVPYQIFPHLFPSTTLYLPWIEYELSIEFSFIIYSIILLIIEIFYLSYINITSVAKISSLGNEKEIISDTFIEALVDMGLEKPNKDILMYGIDPYEGRNKRVVFIIQAVAKLKAGITGFIWRLILKKILGRYLVRVTIDLLSAPVYAFWNAYASLKVTKEAKVVILAQPIINNFVLDFSKKYSEDEAIKALIYSVLKEIAKAKQTFHYNHFLLADKLFTSMQINIHLTTDIGYMEIFQSLSTEQKRDIERLFLLGLIVDGNFSKREKKYISNHAFNQASNFDFILINETLKRFLTGASIDKVITT